MFIIVPVVWTRAPLWSGSCSVSPNPFTVARLLEGKEQVLEDRGQGLGRPWKLGPRGTACLASQSMHL